MGGIRGTVLYDVRRHWRLCGNNCMRSGVYIRATVSAYKNKIRIKALRQTAALVYNILKGEYIDKIRKIGFVSLMSLIFLGYVTTNS